MVLEGKEKLLFREGGVKITSQSEKTDVRGGVNGKERCHHTGALGLSHNREGTNLMHARGAQLGRRRLLRANPSGGFG